VARYELGLAAAKVVFLLLSALHCYYMLSMSSSNIPANGRCVPPPNSETFVLTVTLQSSRHRQRARESNKDVLASRIMSSCHPLVPTLLHSYPRHWNPPLRFEVHLRSQLGGVFGNYVPALAPHDLHPQ